MRKTTASGKCRQERSNLKTITFSSSSSCWSRNLIQLLPKCNHQHGHMPRSGRKAS